MLLKRSVACRASPYGNPFYDGISLETTEVMFVKVKERFLNLKWDYAWHAKTYDKWLSAAEAVNPHAHLSCDGMLQPCISCCGIHSPSIVPCNTCCVS